MCGAADGAPATPAPAPGRARAARRPLRRGRGQPVQAQVHVIVHLDDVLGVEAS